MREGETRSPPAPPLETCAMSNHPRTHETAWTKQRHPPPSPTPSRPSRRRLPSLAHHPPPRFISQAAFHLPGYVPPLACPAPDHSRKFNALHRLHTFDHTSIHSITDIINTAAEQDSFPYSFPVFLPVNASTSRAIKSSRDSSASASRRVSICDVFASSSVPFSVPSPPASPFITNFIKFITLSHRNFNPVAAGSSPAPFTNFFRVKAHLLGETPVNTCFPLILPFHASHVASSLCGCAVAT